MPGTTNREDHMTKSTKRKPQKPDTLAEAIAEVLALAEAIRTAAELERKS